MAARIYVKNLPSDITEERLKDVFSQIGAVEAVKLETDLFSHRPKGTAYVEMSLDVDAYRAINCLNNAAFKEKKISLRETRPFHERARDILRSRIGIFARIAPDREKKVH